MVQRVTLKLRPEPGLKRRQIAGQGTFAHADDGNVRDSVKLAAIRDALDRRQGSTSGERARVYGLISELASHPTYSGISLTTSGPANMANVGPFFDQKKLTVWLQEMAMRLSHAAVMLLSEPEGKDFNLLITRGHYLDVVNGWWSKYRGLNVADVAPRGL